MDFELELDRLRIRVRPMSRFVHLLARKLQQPVLDRAPDVAGFRFSNPTLIHFCLLRAVRIVSSLNASIELARYGYSQEIGVLLRTTIEYDTQIDFMVASLDGNGHLSSDAKAFITGYFVDTHRPPRTATKIAKLIQKKIHDQIGARLDKAPIQSDDGKSASDRLSNVYRIFSNYVHGRYPETMDMYGGRPSHFHLNGMSRTPKDIENLEIIDSQITSSALCFAGFGVALKLDDLIRSDPELSDWYGYIVKKRE